MMKNIFQLSRFLGFVLTISAFATNSFAYSAGETIDCEADSFGGSDTAATFEANWDPVKWTVQYSAGSGTGTAPGAHQCSYGSTCTAVTGSMLTKENYFLNGWQSSCSVTGGGTCANFSAGHINPGGSLANATTTDNAIITLTADWRECPACSPTNASCTLSVVTNVCTYTTACLDGYGNIQGNGTATPSCTPNRITLNWVTGGHGTIPSGAPTYCDYGSTFTMPAGMSETGQTFSGWTVNNTTFGAQASVTCNYANLGVYSGSVTITGAWGAKTVAITYETSKGTAPTQPATCTYGGTLTLPAAPTGVSGYKFAGWTLK